jgi:D-beta-D-heptose 7-phosphate kinase/D-beta-D-heptose 1-phosphate adenosyltransferase
MTNRIPKVDAICIEDYGKGMITPEIVRHAVKLAKKHNKIITVDPKEDHLSYYRGVTAITPNHHEAAALTGIKIKDEETLEEAGNKLLKTLACENVLITRGENGMALFQSNKKSVLIPTVAQDVYDVSGAGDTVIGTFTLARALKATPMESAYLANCAAGIVVGKVGTAVVKSDELLEHIRQMKEKGE